MTCARRTLLGPAKKTVNKKTYSNILTGMSQYPGIVPALSQHFPEIRGEFSSCVPLSPKNKARHKPI